MLLLADLPPGTLTIATKCAHQINHRDDGSVKLYKARLIAKGFLQRLGTDSAELYAPVIKNTTLHFLLNFVEQRQINRIQIGFRSTFLDGKLQEEPYWGPL